MAEGALCGDDDREIAALALHSRDSRRVLNRLPVDKGGAEGDAL
jgi:hypothetical protein